MEKLTLRAGASAALISMLPKARLLVALLLGGGRLRELVLPRSVSAVSRARAVILLAVRACHCRCAGSTALGRSAPGHLVKESRSRNSPRGVSVAEMRRLQTTLIVVAVVVVIALVLVAVGFVVRCNHLEFDRINYVQALVRRTRLFRLREECDALAA